MTKKFKFETCQFVLGSSIFAGLNEAWNRMADSDPPFTWGNNNRSLVNALFIASHLDDLDDREDSETKQIKTAVRRLRSLGDEYVDLEN